MNNFNKYFSGNFKRIIGVLIFLFILVHPVWAHVVPGELEKMSKSDAAVLYLELGFLHILPFGFDHILFILSLFLLSPKLKPVLWQVTAFTVAHSITLGLAMYHVITPVTKFIEPLITISILYVALENIFSPRLKASRVGIVFLFGLVHGMGFAGALGQIGLPQNAYLLSLIMFNLGVELGQLTVILMAYFLVAKWFGNKPYYRKNIVIPVSALIAVIAGIWTIQRIII
jgi:HupE / UreJ protein